MTNEEKQEQADFLAQKAHDAAIGAIVTQAVRQVYNLFEYMDSQNQTKWGMGNGTENLERWRRMREIVNNYGKLIDEAEQRLDGLGADPQPLITEDLARRLRGKV
jgi:5,10-methylenetetrahydrofolate reductase